MNFTIVKDKISWRLDREVYLLLREIEIKSNSFVDDEQRSSHEVKI